MSILADEKTVLLIQGITGRQGRVVADSVKSIATIWLRACRRGKVGSP